MADVFVSYARQDRPRAKPLVELLEAQGWSVWWDREIGPGSPFRTEIEREIARARCVIVLWTAHSVDSDWVNAEASEGLSRRALIPVRLEDVNVPLVFRQTQACDLPGWPDRHDADELTALLGAVASVIERPVTRPPAPRPHRPSMSGILAGVAMVVLLAAVAALWVTRSPSATTEAPPATTTTGTAPASGAPARVPTLGVSAIEGLPAGAHEEIERGLGRIGALHLLRSDDPATGTGHARFQLQGVLRDGMLTLSLFDTRDSATRTTFRIDLDRDGLQRGIREAVRRIAREFGSDLPWNPEPVDADTYLEFLSIRTALRSGPSAAERDHLVTELEALVASAPRFAEGVASLCTLAISRFRLTQDSTAFERAERTCARATRLDATNPWVERALGDLYEAAGQLEQAESAYARALDLSPNMTEAITGRARIARRRGQTEQAEALLLRAQDQAPSDWGLYRALGDTYFYAGAFEQAARQYEEALRWSRGSAAMLNDLGSAYFMMERFDAATDRWQRSVDREPTAPAYTNLGSALYFTGDLEGALDAYRKGIELRATDYRMWLNAGEAAFHLAGTDSDPFYRRSIELAKAAWQVNPDSAEVQSALALASASVGEAAEARRWIDRLRDGANLDLYALYDLAVTYRRLGEEDRALRTLEELLAGGYPRALLERDASLEDLLEHLPMDRGVTP